MLRRVFIFLLYCLFVLGIVAVFLVLFFPRDKFLGWASSYIGKKVPGIELSMRDIKYVHPLKIRIYQLTLSDDRQRWEIPVDTVLMSVKPGFPVEHLSIIGVMSGGDLSFDLAPASKSRLELRNLQISELLLADLKMVEQAVDRPLEGILSLQGRATVNYRKPGDLRFTGTMRIDNFSAPLKQPVLEETEVRFERVESELVYNGGVVDIAGGTARGALFDGTFSGQVWGAVPLSRSRLEVEGALAPAQALVDKHPALAEPLKSYLNRYMTDSIPFRIEGTAAEPVLKLANYEWSGPALD